MWANTTLSLFSPATVTTTRINRRPFTISAKPQKNIKYDYDSDETEPNPELLETLKQQHVGELEPVTYVSNSDTISGSVVLLALQKASAKKKKIKINNKKKKVRNIKDDNNKEGGVVEDYGDVKELCVKSEWKDRLDELEMQLHQLIHHS